jgi:hypothetical protein
MARAAAIFMVFIPLRPVGMWRIDPSTEKQSEGVQSVEVFTREKTDDLKGGSMVVIRPLKDERLCPLRIYRLLKEGARKKGRTDCLWCTLLGKSFKSQDRICKLLKDLLLNAGIPSRFTADSIRHAMITACCKFMPENEVNAFTGHSFNAHTVLQNYNHMDMVWAGNRLAEYKSTNVVLQPISKGLIESMERGKEERETDDEQEFSDNTATDKEELGTDKLK